MPEYAFEVLLLMVVGLCGALWAVVQRQISALRQEISRVRHKTVELETCIKGGVAITELLEEQKCIRERLNRMIILFETHIEVHAALNEIEVSK